MNYRRYPGITLLCHDSVVKSLSPGWCEKGEGVGWGRSGEGEGEGCGCGVGEGRWG